MTSHMVRLEQIVARLPQVARVDIQAWDGEPTFRVNGKNFIFTDPAATAISVKLPKEEAAAVIANDSHAEPTGYGLGRHGWISVKIPEDTGEERWREIEEWIRTSYTLVAPSVVLGREATRPLARLLAGHCDALRRPSPHAGVGRLARGQLWFSSANGSRKARNLANEQRCVMSTEDLLEPVVVEGWAQRVIDAEALGRMLVVVNAKYGTDYGIEMMDPASNSVFALRPEWVFALDSKDFTGSATRFVFSPEVVLEPAFPGTSTVMERQTAWATPARGRASPPLRRG